MPAPTQLLQDGRYRISNQIPLNGQTSVYEAYDTVRNVNVVVKEIVVHLNKVTTAAQQEQMRLAFAEQAKILREVDHDSLLQVVDYFSEIGRQYLVLEDVDGDCLADAVESGAVSFASADVVKWGDQLLDAISYLHNHNPTVIHGSIRPQNIKLLGDGRIKLLDVGIPDASGNKISTSIFAQGVDTEISYSPLEQIWSSLDPASQKVIANSFDEANARALNEPLGPRSDVYALAATLYHLLTGRKPVDSLERAIDILDGKPDPLKPVIDFAPIVEPEISDVVMKGMSIKIGDRFESASMMRQVLKTSVVRAKEREAEEEREHQEAAEVLRNTTPRTPITTMNFRQAGGYDPATPPAPAPPVTPAPPVPASTIEADQSALLAQKLREVEEQRLLAEQRAAEAERLLREKEAAMARAATSIVPVAPVLESDLLEIPFGPLDIPSVPPVRQAAPIVIPAAPIISDPEPKPEVFTAPERELESFEPEADPFISQEPDHVYEAADTGPTEPAYANSMASDQDGENHFALGGDYSAAQRSSLPISAIAGGGALLVVLLIIGGWFMLGSSENTPAPTQMQTTVSAEPPAAVEPAVTEQANLPEQVSSAAPDPAATDQPVIEPAAIPSTATPARTPRKPAAVPAKTPVKKAVTVDDLIRDN